MLDERFIELLTKKLSAEIEADELLEFNTLLTQSEEYRHQYAFFKDYWVQDQERYSNSGLMLQRIKERLNIHDQYVADEPKDKKHNFFSLFRIMRSIAAVLLALLGAIGVNYYAANPANQIHATPLGLTKTPSRVKSKITLSDGSVVTLNSETTLKYPPVFAGKTREVYLNGEAFFDVAKDHEHPFIVHAGKMSIKVLGTAFNIKSYNNDASSETTLLRGAIEVTLADRPSDRIILKPNEKLVLTNNQQTIIGRQKRHKQLTNNLASSYALTSLTYLRSNDSTIVETSWVDNKLVFKDEDFTALANKMQRWYGVKFKFKAKSSYSDYRFTGIFEKESVTQAMAALKMIEDFNYDYKNGTVIIY